MTATTSTQSALTIDQVDTSARAALARFRAHPAVALTEQAFTTTADGVKAIWTFEQENKFGQSVALFLKDIFMTCLLPLLSLLWLALATGWNWALNPETHRAIVDKWNAFAVWIAPKFAYNRNDAKEAQQ